jgi:D-sedoheptulose 7-phosphate isomerase
MVIDTYDLEKKVFVCGNGGNASFVGNFVTDLNLHPFMSEDKSKPMNVTKRMFAINLTDSASTITGILNDVGADFIFSEQMKYSAKTGDLFVGLSGSGNSKNILEAMKLGKTIGMKNILITKYSKSNCAQYADLIIEIVGNSLFPGQTGKNNNNFHFEDCISKLSHIATGILKEKVKNENQS